MTLQQYRQMATSCGQGGTQVPTGAAVTCAHQASDMSPEEMRSFSYPGALSQWLTGPMVRCSSVLPGSDPEVQEISGH